MKFPKVRLKHVYRLYEIFSHSNKKELSWIKNIYDKEEINFDELISFLLDFNIIDVRKNKLSLLVEKNDISDVLTKKIIVEGSYDGIFFDFINSSEIVKENLIIKPSNRIRLILSELKNLLLDLELLKYDYREETYQIDPSLIFLINQNSSNFLNKKKFEYLKKHEKVIGNNAEKEILKYERTKLKNYPELKNKIEYVAETNVAAGYDIKSFEINCSIDTILIEVKAVSQIDYQFFWSRNEIKTAKENPNQYCLYLLPVKNGGKFEISKLKIIKHPYSNTYLGKKWNKEIEKYSFSRIEE